MTKKDYILIADCLNTLVRTNRAIKVNKSDRQALDFMVYQVINKFARELAIENPSFNFTKFIEACNK